MWSFTAKIFFAKTTFFGNCYQITCFLWSLEKNEYAGIKYPINLKHPKKTSIDDDTDSKSREMSLLNLQSLGFLNKKKKLFLDFKKIMLTGQTSILLKISGCIQPPSLGIRCIFYDFDLYKINTDPTIYIKY